MSEPLALTLGRFVESVSKDGVSAEVSSDIKRRLLDTLGNSIAAVGTEPAVAAKRVVRTWGGADQAHILGEADSLPAPSAALVNGTLAHSLDFDDTHLPSVLHPSSSVIPASLAAAEMFGSSGRDVIGAIAAGIEVCVRTGMAAYDPNIRNSVMFENGFHATSICGTLGSAAAAAALFGLDAKGIAHALGIAASMGSGIIEANRTGGTVKPLHCGWAAHSGITAALLAQSGLTGPREVFEGRFGFYQAFSAGRYDASAITSGLGQRWETLRVFFKPYPANHFTHAAVDAAMALREAGLDAKDIDEIELGVAGPTLRTIAEPIAEKQRPTTPYAAKFSGPFVVASALLGGGGLGIYLDDFSEETIRDSQRLDLAAKVRCIEDPESTQSFPYQFPGVLTVKTKAGASLQHRVTVNRGSSDLPLSSKELAKKFSLNASRKMRPAAADNLRLSVESLESLDSVGVIMSVVT